MDKYCIFFRLFVYLLCKYIKLIEKVFLSRKKGKIGFRGLRSYIFCYGIFCF